MGDRRDDVDLGGKKNEVKRRLGERLHTYYEWTSQKGVKQLATAGFIYTGQADKVQCYSCGIQFYNWQEDDDPLHVHRAYAPKCVFMNENFPLITPNPPVSFNCISTPVQPIHILFEHDPQEESGHIPKHILTIIPGGKAKIEFRGEDSQTKGILLIRCPTTTECNLASNTLVQSLGP